MHIKPIHHKFVYGLLLCHPLIDVTDASHQGLSYRIIIVVLHDYVIVYILSLSCLFIIHLLDYARAVMF